MNKFILCLLILLRISCFADSPNSEKLKLETCYDFILWIGLDYPEEFDSRYLGDDDKENGLKNGLLVCEEGAREGNGIAQCLLAKYYYTSVKNKNLNKALYWANKCAEQGIADGGMTILWLAYNQGNGVVKDLEEGLKWCFLAAAKGDESAKEKVEEITKISIQSDFSKTIVDEAKRRANKWMQQHPEVFFNPD